MEVELLQDKLLYLEKAKAGILLNKISSNKEFNGSASAEFIIHYYYGQGNSIVELNTNEGSNCYTLENNTSYKIQLRKIIFSQGCPKAIVSLNNNALI